MSLEGQSLKLWRDWQSDEGVPVCAADDTYTIEYDVDYDASRSGLPFHQAIILVLDLISSAGENISKDSSDYSYSKAQFISAAMLSSLPDSPHMVDVLSTAYEDEKKHFEIE